MFELNIATIPNSILYLEGVQLSYIKVYVHIFNLWHSNKPCYISNAEFAKRTGLHRDTVINAIQFFEKNNVLKRVQKGNKRYLIQRTTPIEVEGDPVDNSQKNCTNIAKGSELDRGGSELDPPHQSELDHHNNKINNKRLNKSFCVNDKKQNSTTNNQSVYNETGYAKRIHPDEIRIKQLNERKHSWSDTSRQERPKPNEPKQCAKFWGPGHESYDRLHPETAHKSESNNNVKTLSEKKIDAKIRIS